MGKLTDAARAAELRKEAVCGEDAGLVYTDNPAVFLGFDLDFEEIDEISKMAGRFFTSFAGYGTVPLLPLFIAAWTDGMLVGLYAAKENGPNG